MKKTVIILFLAVAALGITYALLSQQSIVILGPWEITDQQPVISENYVKYFGQDGKNAFELLQATTPVEYKQYDFGVFVESINSIKPDKQHFWKLYVNGQEAQVGASSLQTKKGDVIEWRLEEIKF